MNLFLNPHLIRGLAKGEGQKAKGNSKACVSSNVLSPFAIRLSPGVSP
jgi:hypothetical protein